jgi:glycosyltransferase involved in cell wall biosynthesis
VNPKIILLTRVLNRGGAQRQLVELAKAAQRRGVRAVVATFYANGPLEQELRQAHVPCYCLHKARRWDVAGFLWRAMRFVRRQHPDILYSYLGTPNIVTALLKPSLRHTRVVWGIRHSRIELQRYDWVARCCCWLERLLAPFADLIIVNSHAGFDYWATKGFPKNRMVVIPNGIDTNRFRPARDAGLRVRAEWGVAENEILIGLVARLDPAKDHAAFLRAAALLAQKHSNVRFVCVGEGPALYEERLRALSASLGLRGRVIWAGPRDDMPAVHNALDIATSSSSHEGLSNAIGEAMACSVPCVVTDVGDSARIVENTGVVVPPQEPQALADGWEWLLKQDIPKMGMQARARIVENFGVEELVERTMGEFRRIGSP